MGAYRRRKQVNFLEPLLSAREAADADAYTLDLLKLSGNELMERAGLAVAHEVESLLSLCKEPLPQVPVVIFCGPGNNGGDGWVAARRLWQNGIRTAVISLVEPESLNAEAGFAAKQFQLAATHDAWALPDLSPCIAFFQTAKALKDFLKLHKPVVVVDAIFGTGLKRPAEGAFAHAIASINRLKETQSSQVHVVSIDIPSGLPSDGQAGFNEHIRADSTLAIQFRKITHLSGPHWLSCGEVKRIDVGIELDAAPAIQGLLAKYQPLLSLLQKPNRFFYKGKYGHVGVLHGSFGTRGASELASYAALRAGAGLVSLLLPDGSTLEQHVQPEIMRHMLTSPLRDGGLDRFSVFVVGPGLGDDRQDPALEIMIWALEHDRPIVVDACALELLAKAFKKSGSSESQIIATPHPGEAARLLKTSSAHIENDRIGAANALLKLSAKWPASVTFVLKGACPIIANRDQGLVVCEGGITTLSVGGSGDVLSGICGALLGQTGSGFDAAVVSVTSHLEAGRRLSMEQSRGYFAHEIADAVAKVLYSEDSKRV